MIAPHFAAFIFLAAPGVWGILAADVGLAALAGAGVVFMYASVPYRRQHSSKWMLLALLVTSTLYVFIINSSPAVDWALTPAAILFGAVPLTLALVSIRKFHHPLRWSCRSLLRSFHFSSARPASVAKRGRPRIERCSIYGLLWMRPPLLVHLPEIHGRRVHHHRGFLRLGKRLCRWAVHGHPDANLPRGKRSLEPAQIRRCGWHDPTLA